MDGELISTAYTYNLGRIAINDAFSGTARFNAIAVKIVTTANTYSVQAGDTFIVQTGTGNINLPPPNGETRIIIAKNYGVGTIDIIPDSAMIDNAPTGITISSMQAVTLQSDGGSIWYLTNYYV